MQEKKKSNSANKKKSFRLLAFKRPVGTVWHLQDFKILHEQITHYHFSFGQNEIIEYIERACCTIFLLLIEGGVTAASPMEKIQALRIDTPAAGNGYIRWNFEKTKLSKKIMVLGPRQFIYLSAQIHLLAFIKFLREVKDARENDLLFVPISEELVSELKRIPWLSTVKKFTWTSIFQEFLKHQLSLINPSTVQKKIDFNLADFRELSLLFLYSKEEPILLEARRYSVTYPSIPDIQFKDLIKSEFDNSNLIREKSSGVNNLNSLEEAEEYCMQERVQNPRLDYVAPTRQVTIYRTLALKEIRGFANFAADTNMPFSEAARKGEELLEYELFNQKNSIDAHFLLKWLVEKFKVGKHKNNQIGTITTEVQRLFYLTDSLGLPSFSEVSIDDLVLFLSEYSSIASITNYLTTFRLFHKFLKTQTNLPLQIIDWNSPSLRCSKSSRENEIITESQFQHLLTKCSASTLFTETEMKMILILQRRAGLRCCEIALLRFVDFIGFSQLRLSINFSKSSAGKRDLPLDLLLSKAELIIFQNFYEPLFINSLTDISGFYEPFLSQGKLQHYTPEQIGTEVTKVLRAANLESQSSHNLRRAFATSLMFGWWLVKTAERANTLNQNDSWTRIALHQFCRPAIEGKIITYMDDIRSLLGHASFDVTLERYIHNLDLIQADAVKLNEAGDLPRQINIETAARLIGCTSRNLRSQIPIERRCGDDTDHRKTNINLDECKRFLLFN